MFRRFALAFLLISSLPALAAEDEAFQFAAGNISDVMANVSGGLRPGMRLLDKADVTAAFNGAAHGLPGLSLFLDLQAGSGGDFSGTVAGDGQTVSSIDGPPGLRLASFWLAREFEGSGGIKAGVIDLNSEFDVQETAALFLNSSFGIGPDYAQAGANGPAIFPATGLGLVGWWLPGEHWQLKAGLFEGTPGNPGHPGRTEFSFTRNEGALIALEARNRITPGFTLGLGAWHHTARFDALDPAGATVSGNSGLYAIADGLLYADEGEETGLSGWARLGLAEAHVNGIGWSASAGLALAAPFGREADQVGLAVTHAHFSAAARRGALASGAVLRAGETAIEATYALSVNDHLVLQPDLQFVLSPGGDPALGDALILGTRIIATW